MILDMELTDLKSRYRKRTEVTDQKRIENIREFKGKYRESVNIKDKNLFLKSIIDRINYSRDGDDVTIEINFL